MCDPSVGKQEEVKDPEDGEGVVTEQIPGDSRSVSIKPLQVKDSQASSSPKIIRTAPAVQVEGENSPDMKDIEDSSDDEDGLPTSSTAGRFNRSMRNVVEISKHYRSQILTAVPSYLERGDQ